MVLGFWFWCFGVAWCMGCGACVFICMHMLCGMSCMCMCIHPLGACAGITAWPSAPAAFCLPADLLQGPGRQHVRSGKGCCLPRDCKSYAPPTTLPRTLLQVCRSSRDATIAGQWGPTKLASRGPNMAQSAPGCTPPLRCRIRGGNRRPLARNGAKCCSCSTGTLAPEGVRSGPGRLASRKPNMEQSAPGSTTAAAWPAPRQVSNPAQEEPPAGGREWRRMPAAPLLQLQCLPRWHAQVGEKQ